MIENIQETLIPGCYVLKVKAQKDHRGSFTKIFHEGVFKEYGLDTRFKEQYYSVSRKGVLRGLHFQTPPEEHTKLVCCIHGSVIDAVVDLRIGSPAYGMYKAFELIVGEGTIIYMPSGVAHGFYATGHDTVMLYNTTKVYNPQYDKGILWNSAGIPWPAEEPVISERDMKLPPLKEFPSPFQYFI